MSRVTQIITDARSILADASGDRYTDARLLALYNQCLKEIVIESNCLHGKAFIEIESNINTYNMPDEVLQINRVQYLDMLIPVMSHDKMDELDYLWETRTGETVKYVITNLVDAGTLKIFPRITDTTMDYIDANSDYGIIVDLETFDDIYNLPNISEINDIPKYLVVYYAKIPDTITIDTLDTAQQFSKVWDNAIIHFIAGMALRDDADQQNRAFGAEELQLYAQAVNNIVKREMTNSTANINSTVSYRGAF
jgi:hypothetical protein